uniref:Uncharacterized protein n=1 Tax=Siphoviridae sp. ctOba29 TaxID=2825480 RepID=A0A8S5NW08_9CAUD|nr:MAG TPA: hypothetical protein [Siphoviridae sp. ctOba29]
MSEFNIFAKRLDEAFRKSCSEYNAAFHALECAQQASRDANAWRPGDSAEEKQVRTARAALKLHDAEATFNEVSARVWDNFKATRRTIRAELEQAVRTADIVKPDAINSNALELMKSGVMTSDDYAAFVKKYGNNPTMLRLISHYSAAAAKAQDGSSEAAALNSISDACQSWKGKALQKFDDLSDYCGNITGREEPDEVSGMIEKWDELSLNSVENF